MNDYEQATRNFEAAESRVQDAETVDENVALDFLATLSPFDYDRTRKQEARRLGVRLTGLDRAVAKRREQLCSATKPSGTDSQLVDFEPAKESVNGIQMMRRLVETVERYIVLPPYAAVAIALWIVRAHAHECFDVSPRLGFLSPEKRCGKTTALEVVSSLTPRAMLASNATPASIFRFIEAAKPTLILDEMDTFKDSHPELRGILNSGHRRLAAYVLRCVGDEHETKAFSTWCSMVFAAIGKLPDTLEDRTIIIPMRRRAKSEPVHPLRWTGKRGDALRASLTMLGRAVARWAGDHAEVLRQQDPSIPEQLNDRAGDNWSPLLAIADEIGGEWPELAREAAIALSGTNESDDDSIRIQLLTDVRGVFAENGSSVVQSQRLCEQLAAMEERPWATWKRGHSITPAQLAKMLRPFDIRSRDVWIADRGHKRCVKGYERQDFEDTFTRYLAIPSQPDVSKREDARTRSRSEDDVNVESARPSIPRASKRGPIPAPGAVSRVLAATNRWVPPSEKNLRQLTEMWRYVKPIKPIKEVVNNE